MIKSSISIINTKVVAVKKEFLKIFILKPTIGLAYWFMDDGTYIYTFKKSKNRTYRFATHSFPFEDQERLVQALKDNFEIAARSSLLSKRNVIIINYIFWQNKRTVLSIWFALTSFLVLLIKFINFVPAARTCHSGIRVGCRRLFYDLFFV